MMNRRDVLALVGKSAALTAACHSGLQGPSLLEAFLRASPEAQAQMAKYFEELLQEDMTLLAKRVYSEEGIPMILACEDLTAKAPVAPASRSMNDAIAPAFEKYAAAWMHLHPEAPVGDVAKLLELLAYRDFSGGGKDTNL